MKNRLKRLEKSKYRKLKISLLLQTVLITALTVLVGGFLLEYIIDGVYNDDVSEIFIGFLKFFHVKEPDAIRLYWRILGNNKTFFMMIGFLALFALFFYIALSKMITYLEDVEKEIGKLVSRSTEPIHLITELEPIETKLNNIKYTLERQEREVQESEQRKNDLVVFLAHDLKTPLTSIINYVDLLKREQIPGERAQEYLKVLDQKSQRLKNLTEDLVEASKASSGNVKLEMTTLDIVEMIWQTNGEFEEKFTTRSLELVSTLPESSILIEADGRHLWRVLENVYNNAFKYAMEHTRVYTDLELKDDKVYFTIKNISANPLNVQGDELTERFVRGDVSRTTEGSGLGLSIAQSLTKLQGGTFEILIDGDLFKVRVGFGIKKPDQTA